MHSGVNEAIDSEWSITTGLFGLQWYRLSDSNENVDIKFSVHDWFLG
jgi:hypothetical protein